MRNRPTPQLTQLGPQFCSPQALQITHLAAPPGCAHATHSHTVCTQILSLNMRVCPAWWCPSSDLASQMGWFSLKAPPAALTRPDQSPANNRVYIMALTSSFLYLTGSERWDLRCENLHVESYPAENRAILLETTESLMFSTLALLWWYRGSYLMICISPKRINH